MKKPAILLGLVLALGLAGCRTTPKAPEVSSPTLKILYKPPTTPFSLSVLSREQRALCAAFRAKAGQYRQKELDEILRTEALPIYAFRMTEADIVGLLGEPKRDISRGKIELSYQVEASQRQAFLFIEFRDGYAILIGGRATIS